MTLKPCVVCGTPSGKSRCDAHRPKDRKPTRQQRGYDAAWERLSKRARRLQPWCTRCGSVTDLQADHSPEAWERHAAGLPIRLTDISVLCGRCNRAAGAARGHALNHSRQHPHAKAEFELHTAQGYVC